MAKNRERRLLSDLKAMEADHLLGNGDFDTFLDRWASTISNIQSALAESFLSDHALKQISETFSTVLAPAAIVHQTVSQLESGIVNDVANAFEDLTLFGQEDEEDDGFIDDPDPPNYLQDWLVANITYPFATSSNLTPEFLTLVNMSKSSFVAWLASARQYIGWDSLAKELAQGDRLAMRKLCQIAFKGFTPKSEPSIHLTESALSALLDMKTAIAEYCLPPPPPWLEAVERRLEEIKLNPELDWGDEFHWDESETSSPQLPIVIAEAVNSPSRGLVNHTKQECQRSEQLVPVCITEEGVATLSAKSDESGTLPPPNLSKVKIRNTRDDVEVALKTNDVDSRHEHAELMASSPPLVPAEPSRVAGTKRKLDDYTSTIEESETLSPNSANSRVVIQTSTPITSFRLYPPTLEEAVATRPTKRTRLDAIPEPTLNTITSGNSPISNNTDISTIASPPFCPLSPTSIASPESLSPLSNSSGSDSGSPPRSFSPAAQELTPGCVITENTTSPYPTYPSISSVLLDATTDHYTSESCNDVGHLPSPACSPSVLKSTSTTLPQIDQQAPLDTIGCKRTRNHQVQIYKEDEQERSSLSPASLPRPDLPDLYIERKRKRPVPTAEDVPSSSQIFSCVACMARNFKLKAETSSSKTKIHKTRPPHRTECKSGMCSPYTSDPLAGPVTYVDGDDIRPRKRPNLAQRDYSLSPDP